MLSLIMFDDIFNRYTQFAVASNDFIYVYIMLYHLYVISAFVVKQYYPVRIF